MITSLFDEKITALPVGDPQRGRGWGCGCNLIPRRRWGGDREWDPGQSPPIAICTLNEHICLDNFEFKPS